MGGDDLSLTRCGTHVQGTLGKHTILGIFGGWADGRGVYWPRKRSCWIAIALENFAARPSPSLCEIRKASSLSQSLSLSEKKGTPSPRSRQRSRPRFSDLSFHQQPCLQQQTKLAYKCRRNTSELKTECVRCRTGDLFAYTLFIIHQCFCSAKNRSG